MKKIYFVAALFMLATTITNCKKTEPEPLPTVKEIVASKYVEVGSITSGSVLLTFFAETNLFVGYNKILVYAEEKSNANQLTDLHLSLKPMMDMGMMSHTSPHEAVTKGDGGLFLFPVVFTMPSTSGTWTIEGSLHNHANDEETEFTLPISVVEVTDKRVLSFISQVDSTTAYFVSLVEPQNPEVGENTFEIAIHKRESMMSFPPVENFTVEIEPEMPTMGHGSPNNVNPTHTSQGHYKGVANFTMSGYWKVNITIKNSQNKVEASGLAFDINF